MRGCSNQTLQALAQLVSCRYVRSLVTYKKRKLLNCVFATVLYTTLQACFRPLSMARPMYISETSGWHAGYLILIPSTRVDPCARTEYASSGPCISRTTLTATIRSSLRSYTFIGATLLHHGFQLYLACALSIRHEEPYRSSTGPRDLQPTHQLPPQGSQQGSNRKATTQQRGANSFRA